MLFNSYIFILLFLPLSLVGYFSLNRCIGHTAGKIWLTLMSLWFYGYFNPQYLWIIVASVLINYGLYRLLEQRGRTAAGRALLTLGVLLNIGVLFYYKYFDFVRANIGALLNREFDLLGLLLPLGISFFTFQQVGFLIDTYKGETGHCRFTDYALFVTFFPQLIAGPIVTYDEMLGQFADETRTHFRASDFAKGIYAFSLGLAKKVLLADVIGNAANYGYDNVASLSGLTAFLTMLCYMLQIYFDFSGYCDMARGIGMMFRIDLPVNFLSPYKGTNVDELWRGWHITLTRFLKKYVYFPLGGSRKGKLRAYLNLFIVFFVSGIWHGANWTYIMWGTMHGVATVFCKLCHRLVVKIPRLLMWPVHLLFVTVATNYFRASSIAEGNLMLQRLWQGGFALGDIPKAWIEGFSSKEFFYVLRLLHMETMSFFPYILPFGYLLAGWAIVLFGRNVHEMTERFKPTVLNCCTTAFLLIWSIVSLGQVSTFLYFNF